MSGTRRAVRARALAMLAMLATLAACALVACAAGDATPRRDARRVVAAFDAVMEVEGDARLRAIEQLRRVQVVTDDARRAQTTCLALFDTLARATALDARLRPYSTRLAGLADAGLDLPPDERATMLALYEEAMRATESAATKLPDCMRRIDSLRIHGTRTR